MEKFYGLVWPIFFMIVVLLFITTFSLGLTYVREAFESLSLIF